MTAQDCFPLSNGALVTTAVAVPIICVLAALIFASTTLCFCITRTKRRQSTSSNTERIEYYNGTNRGSTTPNYGSDAERQDSEQLNIIENPPLYEIVMPDTRMHTIVPNENTALPGDESEIQYPLKLHDNPAYSISNIRTTKFKKSLIHTNDQHEDPMDLKEHDCNTNPIYSEIKQPTQFDLHSRGQITDEPTKLDSSSSTNDSLVQKVSTDNTSCSRNEKITESNDFSTPSDYDSTLI